MTRVVIDANVLASATAGHPDGPSRRLLDGARLEPQQVLRDPGDDYLGDHAADGVRAVRSGLA
jgi:hypothetical protein